MSKIALFASALLLVAADADAAVLYSTTPVSTSLRFSDYGEISESGFRTFDDFTIDRDASVQTVRWRGIWVDLASPSPAAAPLPDVVTWEVAFYANSVDQPGALLSSQSFAAADVTSTFLGFGNFTAGNTYLVRHYEYAIVLPVAFGVSADTTYWLSVFSRSPYAQPGFAWGGATGGDDRSIQQVLGAGVGVLSTGEVARDRNFTLEGTVPEPASLLLLAPAVVALFRRRRRAK